MPALSVLLVLLLSVAARLVSAAPVSGPLRAEIDALLVTLQNPACQFYRNGSWYPGTQAREHLLSKLSYIEKRGTLESTEQFIELAATKSSFSGKPYQVKCGNDTASDSQPWLMKQLSTIRQNRAVPPTSRPENNLPNKAKP